MNTTSKTQVATQVATATPTPATGLIAQMAQRYSVDPAKLNATLKATAFKQRKDKQGNDVIVTDEQMLALLAVSHEYGLNPFLKEIYAFPSEQGIVPIIGFDGWIRLINTHPMMESISIKLAPEGSEDPWIEVTIERKDRTKPVVAREYLSECYRETGPWKSHPRRMLRHKAIIQCGRIAFGFAGVYDPDEADRVVASVDAPPRTVSPSAKPLTQEPKPKSAAKPEPKQEAKPASGETLSVDQLTAIRDKLKEAAVDESSLLAWFEFGFLEEIPANAYADALRRIDELAAES